MSNPPTTEDRIWAVISHLSTLASGMGIALPIVGWSDQRRKSNYASFQCLQALGYQSLGFTIWILSYLVVIIVVSITVLAVLGPEGESSGNTDARLRPWIVIMVILLVGLFALYFVLPIIAVVACALGRDFRYPILGDRLARYLGYEPSQEANMGVRLNEDHELRWVAAMGHFSILILLWGMLAPLTAWILHGKQSIFLKFQSIQTLVYQAVATSLYFVAMLLYTAGVALIFAGLGAIEDISFNSPIAVMGMVLFAVTVLFSILLLLLVPFMHILGQWAGYRLLKGDNYRYPLVGRLVDKWISNHTTIEEN